MKVNRIDLIQYSQACDLLLKELEDRFEQSNLLRPVLALECLLLKAANGLEYDEQLEIVKASCWMILTLIVFKGTCLIL